jgi:Tol biopolymer transport system component
VYHDNKGYEDPWRKHHTSSITRDVWLYDAATGKHTQLTTFAGEDRNPVLTPDEKELYFLSEGSGSFNVHRMSLDNPSESSQVTRFTRHPVRFLTMAENGTLCYGYDGELYTQAPGGEPRKLEVQILTTTATSRKGGAHQRRGHRNVAVTQRQGDCLLFRGEVFVTSTDGGVTKRVTNTPEQERSVTFSPDGRTLLYAAERGNNWNVYKTSIVRKEEPYFSSSTVLDEQPVVATRPRSSSRPFRPTARK